MHWQLTAMNIFAGKRFTNRREGAGGGGLNDEAGNSQFFILWVNRLTMIMSLIEFYIKGRGCSGHNERAIICYRPRQLQLQHYSFLLKVQTFRDCQQNLVKRSRFVTFYFR